MAVSHCSNYSSEQVLVDDNEIGVTIRFDTNRSCLLGVKRTTTIKEIKQFAGIQEQLLPSSINLVFAGQLLDDRKTVGDYDLGEQTTIHAFCRSSKTSSVNDGDSDSALQSHSSFFVYCKICDNICAGKLRVCCCECNSPVFLLQKGPSNWEDISAYTAIRGECKNQDCNGTIPRFYLKCSHPHELEEKEMEATAVALKHIQSNRKQVECIVCQEIVSPVLIFPCPPGHVICLECFRQYSISSLNARQFVEHNLHGYTLSCPSGQCESFHIEDSHHFCVMGKNEYERFKNFGAEEYVLQNGGILCPSAGCGMGLFPNSDDDTRIKCTECQFVSCKQCKREFHFGSCQDSLQSEITNNPTNLRVDSERAQRASWEMQSLSLIEEISKSCPGCKVKTQHSGGCLHMSCTRCHMDWCWLCVKPWDRECQEDHWFG